MLALPTVQLCFLERNLLLLGSQESEPSCPLNWGHLIHPLKDRTPYFLKTWEIGAGYQLRIASRWESQGIEGPSVLVARL